LRIPDSEGYHVCGNTLYHHDAGFVQLSLSQSIATGIECGRECKTSPYKLCTGLSIKLYPQPPFPHPAVWCAQLVYPSILPEGGVYAKRCRYHTQARTQVLCLKKECIILRRPCFVLATLVVNQAVIGGGVSSGDCDLAASFRRRVRGELGECGRVGRFGERVGDDDADECLLVGEWLARGRYPCPTCACTVRTCRPCDRATSCSR